MTNGDQIITADMVPHSRELPNGPSLVVMLDADRLSAVPDKFSRLIYEAALELSNVVPRGKGVVVVCWEDREIWRAHYGEPLSTKRCIQCGDELLERVHSTTLIGRPGDPVGAFFHFCEKHPDGAK